MQDMLQEIKWKHSIFRAKFKEEKANMKEQSA
jgi:hypothetical protein